MIKEDKTMKKYFSIIMIAAAIMACAKEQNAPEVDGEPQSQLVNLTFTGYSDDGLTKTTLDTDDWGIKWSKSDYISVFAGSNDAESASFQSKGSGRITTFNGESETASIYYALSPAQNTASISNGEITATLPSTQTAVASSFGPEANISVATATDVVFQFKNVGALIGITVGQDDITGIKLEAVGGEALSGTAVINATDGSLVSKNGESYVQMSGSLVQDNTYYFVILPGTYASGFRVTLYKGTKYTRFTKGGSETIERNENLFLGSFSGNNWKETFTVSEPVKIMGGGAAEAGQELAYVGSNGYWNDSIQYSDVENYPYNYEIFTRLNQDQKFYFHTAGGENYTLNSAGNAVESLAKITNAPYGAPENGIYRIRMVLPEGAAEVKKISEVKYDLYGLDSRALTYQGYGVWSSEGFHIRTRDHMNRYRFLVKFADETKQYYGRKSSTGGNPVYGTTTSEYFHVQPSIDSDSDHWSPCFMYPSSFQGKENENRFYCTMTLSMNNNVSGHYTHSVTNIIDSNANLTTGNNLYIGGSGADEAGQKFVYSTSFSSDGYSDASGLADPTGYDYEIFTKLNNSSAVYFYTDEGAYYTFNSTRDGLTKITNTGSAITCAWSDGVYRIRIKSSDLSASIVKLNSIDYVFCSDNTSYGNAAYYAEGVWVFSNIQIPWDVQDWFWDHNKDTRYKFKFTFLNKNDAVLVQFYGKTHDVDLGIYTPEAASGGHYNLQPVDNEKLWDDSFKAPYSITDGATAEHLYCDITIFLNDTQGKYTHSWVKSQQN